METGLTQGDKLSPMLFNIALEKVVRIFQDKTRGINVNQHNIKVLGFADYLNIIGYSSEDTARATVALERTARQI